MDFLFYLKLCGFAAMGLVAALVFRRGLAACHERVRGMSAWQRAAAMAFLAVAVVYGGGKTNGVDGAGSAATNLVGMGSAPRRSAAPAYPDTVTDGEIAQGWRWTSGWTPAAVSHAMPDDARYGSKWHVRGAFQDVARVALDGWDFPYGSNALDHVWAFVDGRLRPALRRRGEDIVAVGCPMSAVPGRSRFWTRQTDDSALFTWENHFLARDTNRSVDAQVELWPNGDFAVRFLESRGVDCAAVRKTSVRPTSFTDVMTVEGTGERTFFNLHGADSTLVPEDVDVAKLDCGIFHFGYLLLLDGMDAPDDEYGTKAARLLAKVRAAGIRTSVDIVSEQSDRFARIVRPALKHCDYCIINEVEGSMATGKPADDLKGICEGLFELGVKERVVVHRPEVGVTMGRGGDFTRVGSLKLPAGWIKGSVGAGDAFCAGALYSLLKGFDPEKTLRLASCAAAMNLTVPDSVSGAKSYEETMNLDNLYARLP